MPEYRSASGSAAEDLFIDLFADTFGAEKAGYLYSQYPFYDIYQNARICIHSTRFTTFIRMPALPISCWKTARPASPLRSTMRPPTTRAWYRRTSSMMIC